MANTVLIITSDADTATLLQETLATARDGPFTCVWVQTLSEALIRLKADSIEIILVDLFLPDSQGIETFDVLFKLVPPIPIMILSQEEEILAVEAVERGAQGYLSKGYLRDSLIPQALRNIIQRKRIEQALYIERERSRVTLESIGDGVLSTNNAMQVTYLNPEAERLTGWSNIEARGRPVAEVFHVVDSDLNEIHPNPVELVIAQQKSFGLYANSILIRRDGLEIPIEDSIAPIFDTNRVLTGAVVTFHDVTEARAMVQKMAHLAQHDYLTGLPNRMLLSDRLTQAVAYAKRHGTELAVLFCDLDNFKHINDSLGHLVGDKLLQVTAERLVSNVRASDTVCRQGGDEFVILLLEEAHAENAAITAEKILQSLTQPYNLFTHELHITTSIGISLYPGDGETADDLIKSADTAMYFAKSKGRDNYQFFTDEMNARAVERQTIEVELRRALSGNEFFLNYQPKINLESGAITGVEVLIRWHHPEKGTVFPEAFIEIAEDCGLIVPIGKWVLLAACKQAKAWEDQDISPVCIAINISALEFVNSKFLDYVKEVLDETGLNPKCLELELTETVLMRDAESSINILHALKSLGVRIAVDDFGTGYSSLNYLSQFPIDVIKIDKSFVQDISSRKDNGIIVSAVISMGTSLRQTVIAEGIETNDQLDFLNAHDCHEGQGYLFSQPLTADACRLLLAQGNVQTMN